MDNTIIPHRQNIELGEGLSLNQLLNKVAKENKQVCLSITAISELGNVFFSIYDKYGITPHRYMINNSDVIRIDKNQ